ncbi:MAG: tetratricopeptide repeat protein [Saprospiraceae bacterium]|nr:tetratricopeptide repeat protein [Saprospiraceae bacterium]
MKNNNHDIELIERYLSDELNGTEKLILDQRLTEDESFAEEFQRRQIAHTTLDYMIAKNLKAQLQELERENKGKVVAINKNRQKRLVILSLAASILLIVTFFFIIPQNSMSNAELASAYYESPDLTIRGSETTSPNQELLASGIIALENKEYAKAIATLESVPENNPYYILAQYYLGHAFFAAGQYEQATASFVRVRTSEDIRYQEDAEWYELLSCLAQEADCNALLNKLSTNPNHIYYGKALEIKKQIK